MYENAERSPSRFASGSKLIILEAVDFIPPSAGSLGRGHANDLCGETQVNCAAVLANSYAPCEAQFESPLSAAAAPQEGATRCSPGLQKAGRTCPLCS